MTLEQQLAAALAACKLKDEHIKRAESYMKFGKFHIQEALSIQPGTEALEKWLGEPVAIIGKHGHPKHISAIPSIEENRLYGPFEPLYAKPKGLK